MSGPSIRYLVLVICLTILVGAAVIACATSMPTEAPDPTVHEVGDTPTAEPSTEVAEVSVTPSVEPTITFTCTPDLELEPVHRQEGNDRAWECPRWEPQLSLGALHQSPGGPAYVENQIILTGRADDVETVANEALGTSAEPLRDPISLDWLQDVEMDRFRGGGDGPIVIQVYTGTQTAMEMLVNVYIKAIELELPVFPDLNFVTGYPHIAAGSPHIAAGSPHIAAGSPLGAQRQARSDFVEQWSFGEPPGIGLTSQNQNWSEVSSDAKGVRIGVFDTSPFNEPGWWEIPWITPTMELCVSHLLLPTSTQTLTEDHGLFVAGLIHSTAPSSEIHLIQVLNERAIGSLDTLTTALHYFVSARSIEQQRPDGTEPLTNTVINLSLGFSQPRNLAEFGLAHDDGPLHWYNKLLKVLEEPEGLSSAPWNYDSDELPIVSLETIKAGANARGVTVVAAAGNESTPQRTVRAEVPASFPSVIGVAASDMDGKRACYSNLGDVAAPGGDTHIQDDECANAFGGYLESGVIGPVVVTSPCTGYAYWAGTSFSAPLASGLAALILEKNEGWVAPDDVRDTIIENASASGDNELPSGIINVPGSLQQ